MPFFAQCKDQQSDALVYSVLQCAVYNVKMYYLPWISMDIDHSNVHLYSYKLPSVSHSDSMCRVFIYEHEQ